MESKIVEATAAEVAAVKAWHAAQDSGAAREVEDAAYAVFQAAKATRQAAEQQAQQAAPGSPLDNPAAINQARAAYKAAKNDRIALMDSRSVFRYDPVLEEKIKAAQQAESVALAAWEQIPGNRAQDEIAPNCRRNLSVKIKAPDAQERDRQRDY